MSGQPMGRERLFAGPAEAAGESHLAASGAGAFGAGAADDERDDYALPGAAYRRPDRRNKRQCYITADWSNKVAPMGAI